MGLYVEPKAGTKAEWFAAEAALVNSHLALLCAADKGREELPVAFLDNGGFQALAVLWDSKEFQRVASGRPDAIFGLVAKSKLREVVAGGYRLKELK